MLDWKERCAQRKQAQHDSIPKDWILNPAVDKEQLNVMDIPYTCGILSDRELEITDNIEITLLLSKLRTGQYSSVEVTTAFYKRAIIAQQLTNCLTEIFVERALQRASEVDEHLQRTGRPIGPLHGLPVSLKDQFSIKGLETIMGYVAWIGNIATDDSVLVKLLNESGAVPFCRTNVPQTLMWGETYNHVFGRTLNPYNRCLTSGGSSGGEGALLAMRGSPLGIGTDIDGSLRIPSSFCGLYTLRPSYSRLPYYGAANALQGQESISSVLGPMSNSLSSLKLFIQTIVGAKPWNQDPSVARKPWSEAEYDLSEHGGMDGKLCFSIMWDNGIVKPHPPLQRAMRMTKDALEAAGHTVIDWVPHRHEEIYKNAQTILVSDGGHDYQTVCAASGEPLIADMTPGSDGIPDPEDHPHFLDHHDYQHEHTQTKWPWLIKVLTGEPFHRSAWELWQLHKEKRELRKSYLDHWNSTIDRTGTGRPVDAIITCAVAYTALPHGMNSDAFYTTLGNAMDYSCSIFPVTNVDPALDPLQPPHQFHNHEDEIIYKLYDPYLLAGVPVGLQLIGRTLEEEAVIRMTEIVIDSLERNNKP